MECEDKSNGNENYSANIYLRCDQEIGIGQPMLIYNESCSYNFIWKTTFACPPFDEVDCATMDENMEIFDFSPLTLSDTNYQIPLGTEGQLIGMIKDTTRVKSLQESWVAAFLHD